MVGFGHWQDIPESKPRVRDAHLKRRTEEELEALDAELFKPAPDAALLRRVWVGPITPKPLPHLSEPCGKGTWLRMGDGFTMTMDVVKPKPVKLTYFTAAWFEPRGQKRKPRPVVVIAKRKRSPSHALFDVCITTPKSWRPSIDPPSRYLGSLNCRAA